VCVLLLSEDTRTTTKCAAPRNTCREASLTLHGTHGPPNANLASCVTFLVTPRVKPVCVPTRPHKRLHRKLSPSARPGPQGLTISAAHQLTCCRTTPRRAVPEEHVSSARVLDIMPNVYFAARVEPDQGTFALSMCSLRSGRCFQKRGASRSCARPMRKRAVRRMRTRRAAARHEVEGKVYIA